MFFGGFFCMIPRMNISTNENIAVQCGYVFISAIFFKNYRAFGVTPARANSEQHLHISL
jgi:hypothetical protein